MPEKIKYVIHSDFEKLPVLNIKFTPLIMGVLNVVLKMSRYFRKHSKKVSIQQYKIPADNGRQLIVKVIMPNNVKSNAPAMVYYHGGGFAMTYAGMHLENAERYAVESECIVVFVEYRLAMKNPFPDGFNDAYAGLQWTVDNANKLGINPARIAVGGDSAGGALAAGVAQKARDENKIQLCGQLLIYPVLDNRCNTPSATDFIDVPVWSAISNRRMWEMYLKNVSSEPAPDYAAPGHGEVSGLPRTYIETAEFDPLRDEGLYYANALSDSGNQPIINETVGTVHGYDSLAKSEIAILSLQKRITFLKEIFS